MLKTYDVVIDQHGYPYGDAIETGRGSLRQLARECANLSAEASQEYACRITEVAATSAAEAVAMTNARAQRMNS